MADSNPATAVQAVSREDVEKKENTDTDAIGMKASNLLNMLSFIAEMQNKNRNVTVSLEKLNAAGYGPKEWNFKLVDKVQKRYRVISPGNGASALILREPLIEAKFSNIDSLLKHLIKSVEFTLEKALTMYQEAPNVPLAGVLSTDPETLGVPLSEMCELEPLAENICATIQPFCIANRARNPNYSEGRVAEGLDLQPLREAFFNASRDEMRPLREIVIAFEHHTRQGKPDALSYKNLMPNDMLHILANPFNLNTIFDHLPLSSQYYSELVWELTSPELSVSPLTGSQLMINSTQSMSKLTTLNTFAAINERPEMDTMIGFYVLSLLCPGSVNFTINLDDLPKDEIYTKLLAALASKLLFSYNVNQRWNSLSECSVREVEAAISRAGTAAGALEYRDAVAQIGFPLDNVAPTPRSQLEHFDLLRTTPEGGGWRESGGARYGEPAPTCPYVECQPRPCYVTNLDDITGLDDDIISEGYAAWETKTGVIRLLSCLARGKVLRTPLTGTESVFDMCAHRIYRFYIAMNNYNRENWYTALRPTDAKANNMYDGAIDAPMCVNINGRTILYMLKSLDENSIGARKIPYIIQLHLESALMRDCVETYARERLIQAAAIQFGIRLEHFTRKEIAELTHPNEGPLSKILEHIRRCGYSSRIGDFSIVAENLTVTDVHLAANHLVLDNPLHFGISPSVILNPQIPRNRMRTLRDLSDRQSPYTNVFVPRINAEAPRELLMDDLQNMIVSYSAKEDVREMSLERPLRLIMPSAFEIATGSLSGAHKTPFDVKYQSINRHNTIREAVTMNKRTFCVIPIDRDALLHPDVYLKDANELESVFIPPEDFDSCVETVTQWLANIHIHMNPTRFICTKNVVFCSIFLIEQMTNKDLNSSRS